MKTRKLQKKLSLNKNTVIDLDDKESWACKCNGFLLDDLFIVGGPLPSFLYYVTDDKNEC